MAKPDPTAEVDKLLFDPTSSLDFNNLGKAVTDTFNLSKYEKMSYTDIIASIKKDGVYDDKFLEYVLNTNAQTVADPKSIEELRRSGYAVKPALKGPDSIRNGIDILKRHKLYVTKQSPNLLVEFQRYKWRKDSAGNMLNQPAGPRPCIFGECNEEPN